MFEGFKRNWIGGLVAVLFLGAFYISLVPLQLLCEGFYGDYCDDVVNIVEYLDSILWPIHLVFFMLAFVVGVFIEGVFLRNRRQK